jgi:HlyD family secretion protein
VLAQIEFDKVEHQANAARARLKTMSLQTAVLQQRLEKAQIIAPISGRVVEQLINLGEVIEPGVPLVRLVDFQQVRVEAEVGEFDIPRVALGASVTITAEGFDGQSWSGTIVEVPDWVTSRRLKPLDPGRPSDTRVLPVQTTLPVGHPLKLGQRVEVQIRDTRP